MRNYAGFTLVELMLVVVIMAVLAATVIPEFSSSTIDAKTNTSIFNLHTIRAQIQTYKAQHRAFPATLEKLTRVTDEAGLEAGETGVGDMLYGPYLSEIPEEAIHGANEVATSSDDPIDVGTSTTGGWIYNATTGEVRVNHKDYGDL